jgi:hypothetical protein
VIRGTPVKKGFDKTIGGRVQSFIDILINEHYAKTKT